MTGTRNPVRNYAKRIAVVIETIDGRAFTIYSESPETLVKLDYEDEFPERVPAYPGAPFWTQEAARRFLNIAIGRIEKWTIGLTALEDQRTRLDDIKKGLTRE